MKLKRLFSNTWKTLIWPVAIYVIFLLATRLSDTGSNFGTLQSLETVLQQSILCAMMVTPFKKEFYIKRIISPFLTVCQ